jgi:heterodisulfide reductase subunit A-like polyferredoxin
MKETTVKTEGKNSDMISSNVVSKILVVGGGIAGIQSALDLANSGFKVYLLDKKLSIGGTMAQLDKTFPTNDCSMCILSPKLVDAGRHPNIELLTYSEVETVEGEAGHFRVTVCKYARYVDLDKCKSCGDCTDACPVSLPNMFEEGLNTRHAIYQLFPQANPSAYGIDKRGIPPCRAVCPLHVNVQGYVALISDGKYREAFESICERNPFLGITGRICSRPCETACRRGDVDAPVAIDYLKRFVCDKEWNKDVELPEKAKSSGKKVAIVGSGPAGLLAAYDLALTGHKPTIFEALPVVGGMLAVGIPKYRLPREILNREIELVRRLGVEIKTNICIGRDLTLTDLKNKGYDAVFIAIGAHVSYKLGVPGEDLIGIQPATEFLREFNLDQQVDVGKRIAVIGGGDAAVDAARTALRLAQKRFKDEAEVFIIYRRTILEMPAQKTEIEEAEKEGIKIIFLATPIRIIGQDGKVTTIECQRMKLGKTDSSGRRRPVPIENSEFTLDVDIVLPAIGQKPDISFLTKDATLDVSEWGTITADPLTLETSMSGVFAGGDAVTGPRTYIEAMAAGRKAAISIDRFLEREDLRVDRDAEGPQDEYVEIDIEGVKPVPRVKMNTLPSAKRKASFDEVELGLSEKDAIAEAQRCLECGGCSECMECIKACEPEAIFHDMTDEMVTLDVGSVILAPGFDEFNPKIKSEYGYDRFQNVVSSIEFERILSASGPYQGHVVRPSDEKEPKKIAWIQCVGSRDPHINKGYCSSVCCMYAVKEAVIAKEHAPNVEPTIFHMDIRAYGKDFDKYIDRAEKEYGVRFIRSRISHIDEDLMTHNLQIRYETEDGHLLSEEFDLVVLSVGLSPPSDVVCLAEKFGIDLNKYNFALTNSFEPFKTSKHGIYVAGAFAGPKDIPETVAQASGVATMASSLLVESRGEHVTVKEYPPEIDVRYKSARVGVFICHCGSNIGGFLDVLSVVEYAKTLPHVVYAEDNLYTCSQDTQTHIKDMIKEHNLNRVVIASCTPRTHELLFQDTIKEAGLNPHLFEMANIRDQCSWVHMKDHEKATQKAKDLVRMAIAKAILLKPLPIVTLDVDHKGLVIGGGLTGLTAALKLADEGYEVYVMEKEKELGGHLRELYYTLEGEDVQAFFHDLVQQVQDHRRIHVFTDAEIENITGYIGNFTTTIKNGTKRLDLKHGVIIVATGAEEYHPREYLYGQDSRVITQHELEHRIASGNLILGDNRNVVMIQCVGSRDDIHPYCSRVCCSTAVKNALKIKEINKKSNVYILYRDIRTYGFKEDYYQTAREKGVIFIRYAPERKPEVKHVGNKLLVTVFDSLLDEELVIDTDMLTLSTGVTPLEDNVHLSQLLKVPLNEDGFFLEAHMKLRPVDFATDGIFLAGMAHSPKFIDESISQACAAVSRACTILTKDHLELLGIVAEVNEYRCVGCGLCEEVCGYKAIEMVSKQIGGKEKIVAQVNEALCKGCGACSGACYSGAIQQNGFTDGQILSIISVLGKE